jgi:deoxyribodipyrimidine photo-lyase
MTKSIVYFRRDLRVYDNMAMIEAIKNSSEIFCVFIFDPRQYQKKENEYFSCNSFQFLLESLEDLEKQLDKIGKRLNIFKGNPSEVLGYLFKELDIDQLYFNMDFTPFSKLRDSEIVKVAETNGVSVSISQDIMLNHPDKIKSGTGNVYKVFTPYYKRCSLEEVPKPILDLDHSKISNKKISNKFSSSLDDFWKLIVKNPSISVHGGRINGLKLLGELGEHKDYGKERDYPGVDGTTKMSAYNKYGCFSIREAYWAVKMKTNSEPLIRQLYWRDFYYQIVYHFPYVIGGNYNKAYDRVKWPGKKEDLEMWKRGETGFPFVDAGMRQMNTTGWMHNRVRMVVSQFLTKDLHVDWREGEKYFAQMLVDYDPAQNNGGWQWSGSTGTDAQPYFRIFNPWTQSEKFDKDCKYIKEWIPELKDVPNKDIHTWFKTHGKYAIDYPEPMVDHDKERQVTLDLFK